jgi:hypothetical protein
MRLQQAVWAPSTDRGKADSMILSVPVFFVPIFWRSHYKKAAQAVEQRMRCY